MKKLLVFLVLLSVTSNTFALSLAEPQVLAPMSEVRQTVDKWNFHLDIVSPAFGLSAIDEAINTYITQSQTEFIKDAKELFDEDEVEYTPHASLDITYEVLNDKDDILSVKFDEYLYLWGAHGTPTITTFTLNKKTGKLITFSSKKILEKFSKLVRPALTKYLTEIEMSDGNWILEWTEPMWANFSTFTLESDGNGKILSITFYFQPYQVAWYAAGMPAVKISKDGVVAFQ